MDTSRIADLLFEAGLLKTVSRTGWDTIRAPRTFGVKGSIVKNNTPANFELALRQAKAFVDAHPAQAPLLTLNSWNEWTETSYLQPCSRFGYGYLDAVKKVFGT